MSRGLPPAARSTRAHDRVVLVRAGADAARGRWHAAPSRASSLHGHVPRQARPAGWSSRNSSRGQGEDQKGRVRVPDDEGADEFEQAPDPPLQILENQQRWPLRASASRKRRTEANRSSRSWTMSSVGRATIDIWGVAHSTARPLPNSCDSRPAQLRPPPSGAGSLAKMAHASLMTNASAPVRDTLPIREESARGARARLALPELSAASSRAGRVLPIPGGAHDGDQLRVALGDVTGPRARGELQLPSLAPDKRGI